jgi:S-adenosylmethionine decarboxylase proenzyme
MYDFFGQHFMASYKDCDPVIINDPIQIKNIMMEAIGMSGATIVNSSDYIFKNEEDTSLFGYTAVFLLSESHASIHTYPECQSCFVDLFTCGTSCTYEKFHDVLKTRFRNYMIPISPFENNFLLTGL